MQHRIQIELVEWQGQVCHDCKSIIFSQVFCLDFLIDNSGSVLSAWQTDLEEVASQRKLNE